MHETNLMEAFASYKAKPIRRSRSAMAQNGALVISCWYAGFKKTQPEVLQYEEDLSEQKGESEKALRLHLAEAMASECDVRVIVAVKTVVKKAAEQTTTSRTAYYARQDLVGQVKSFDGQRFVIEFQRPQPVAQGKASKGGLLSRRAG